MALSSIFHVLKNEKEALLSILVFFLMLLSISSTALYLVEGGIQVGFATIPDALWWAIVTATSVGYGDVVPLTPLGKFFGGITAMLGIMLYSMLTAVFATGFSEEFKKHISKHRQNAKSNH